MSCLHRKSRCSSGRFQFQCARSAYRPSSGPHALNTDALRTIHSFSTAWNIAPVPRMASVIIYSPAFVPCVLLPNPLSTTVATPKTSSQPLRYSPKRSGTRHGRGAAAGQAVGQLTRTPRRAERNAVPDCEYSVTADESASGSGHS